MHAKLELQMGYSTELEARTLELPLVSRRMSFFIVLPDYIGETNFHNLCENVHTICLNKNLLDPGLHQLEANFTKEHVKALMSTLQVRVICTSL